MTGDLVLKELVEGACQSGIIDPLLDYLAETEHPKWEIVYTDMQGIRTPEHLRECSLCKNWLKRELGLLDRG